MTGFGAADGVVGALSWRVEARSVNGRGLDLRLRLPSGGDALEPAIRKRVRAALKRGSVTVSVQYVFDRQDTGMRLNDDAVDGVLAALDALAGRLGAPKPDRAAIDPMRIVALRGILDAGERADTLS